MLGYITGVYDILRLKDLQKLDMIIQKNILGKRLTKTEKYIME